MLKINKLKYLISTNVNYYKLTLPLIIPSIISQINKKDIIITISGTDQKIDIDYDIQTYCVPYNSFEYSSLINLIDVNYNMSKYVFLLHDTMICGPRFAELSSNIDLTKNVILAVENGWTNMGAYNVSYLHSIKGILNSMKNINKLKAVQLEGNFFNCKPDFYNNLKSILNWESENIFQTNTRRISNYYYSVDVTKYSANWREHLLKNKFVNVV